MNDFTKQLKDNLGKKPTPLSGQEQDALWDSIATQLDVSGQEQDALWESIANQLDADDLKTPNTRKDGESKEFYEIYGEVIDSIADLSRN